MTPRIHRIAKLQQWIDGSRRLGLALFLAGLVMLSGGLWAAAQQQSQIRLQETDTSRFPTVSVTFDVVDGLGAPIAGLTAPDIQLFEEGQRIPASALRLDTAEEGPISLVLAVDISGELAELTAIKTGLLALVDRMRPGDQAVLLSFANQVRLEQAPTYDLNVLRAAINRLGVEGTTTVLNQAAIEAFDWAARMEQPRRAVVLVADNIQNVAGIPVNQRFTRGDEAGIPAYLLTYGPGAQPAATVQSFAQGIQARSWVLDTATEAALRVQTLPLFQSGYRLTYTSNLPANHGDFTLSLNLTALGAVVRSDAILRSQPGQVEIELPLENGQQVGGLLTLEPQIRAPGPLAQVEILLNGQVVETLRQPPYAYAWDSGQVQPGSHVIGIRAQDSAGNTGERYVTLNVVRPLQIRASTPQASPQVGEEITVNADVTSLAGVAQVVFLINGLTAATLTEPPYSFRFDSSGYTPGTHRVGVQVTDVQGNSERVDFSIELSSPPPRFLFPVEVWLRILAVASIGLAVLLAYLLLAYFQGLAGRRSRRRLRLEVVNQGNQSTPYLLRADDPDGALVYQFSQGGIPLRGREEESWVLVDPEEAQYLLPRQTAIQSASWGQGGNGAQEERSGGAQRSGFAPNMAQVKKAGNKVGFVARLSGGLANLLMALGMVLPDRMGGRALKSAGASVRGVYFSAQGVQRAQSAADRLTGTAQDSGREEFFQQANAKRVAQLTGKDGDQPQPPPASPPAPVYAQPALAHVNGQGSHAGYWSAAPSLPAGYKMEHGQLYRREMRRVEDAWVQTHPIAPGDSLFLDMQAQPRGVQGQRRRYNARIISQARLDTSQALQTTEVTLNVPGSSWLFGLLLPLLVILISAGIVLFMVGFLLTDLGLLPPNSLSLLLEWLRGMG